MENRKYVLLLLLSCGVAHADSEVKTLGDLDRLQGGRVFWDAQAAYNKSKMAAGQAETVVVPSTTTSGSTGSPSSPAVAVAAPVTPLPVLEKVVGTVATLNFSDGTSTMVKAGESVRGGFTVKSISLRGVVIRRVVDGHEFTLN